MDVKFPQLRVRVAKELMRDPNLILKIVKIPKYTSRLHKQPQNTSRLHSKRPHGGADWCFVAAPQVELTGKQCE